MNCESFLLIVIHIIEAQPKCKLKNCCKTEITNPCKSRQGDFIFFNLNLDSYEILSIFIISCSWSIILCNGRYFHYNSNRIWIFHVVVMHMDKWIFN